MKYFFKKQWIWILCFGLLTSITITSLLVRVKYTVSTPATLTSIDTYMEIEGSESENIDISSVSVYSFNNISLFNYVVSKINPFCGLEKIPENLNTSNDYSESQGSLHRTLSIQNSVIAAYNLAGYPLEKTFLGYCVSSISTYHSSDIKINEYVTKIDGIKLTEEYDPNDAIKYAKETDPTRNYVIGTVIRGTEEVELKFEYNKDNNNKIGLSFSRRYDYPIKEEYPQLDQDLPNSYGPSAGLMQALYLYVKLKNISFPKGLKISGTGEIDEFGYVGIIGSCKQKIYTAVYSDVDYFFVPIDMHYTDEKIQEMNYLEAKEALAFISIFKRTNLKIIPVRSLEEAVEELEKII